MYRVTISPQAEREIKKIKKIYRIAIKRTIEDIQDNPYIGKSLTRELEGRYSYKVGPCRIIYKINTKDNKVFVISAGHRATVYQ